MKARVRACWSVAPIFATIVLLPWTTANARAPFAVEVVDTTAYATFGWLALDASGNPHVSYQNPEEPVIGEDALMYASKIGGIWTIEEVSAPDWPFVGYYTSLVVASDGTPHVACVDYNDFTWDYSFRYARKVGGAWIIETPSWGRGLGFRTSIALDAQANPVVSYHPSSPGDLYLARKSEGAWSVEPIDTSLDLVGEWNSLALDAQGRPHVSYYDFTNGNLKYATKAGALWTIETVDASPNDVGAFSSLALDAQGNPHISYYDDSADDVKYARKLAGSWVIELADGAMSAVGRASTSLALDARGFAHITYFDNTSSALRYGRKGASGWSNQIVEASSGLRRSSLELDATGTPRACYTGGGVRYASAGWSALPEGNLTLATADLGIHSYAFKQNTGPGTFDVYPNPSHGRVNILFRLGVDDRTELAVFDVEGRRVRTLSSGGRASGPTVLTWDGRDNGGREVVAGTYFVRASSSNGIETNRRVTVLR